MQTKPHNEGDKENFGENKDLTTLVSKYFFIICCLIVGVYTYFGDWWSDILILVIGD